MATRSRNNRSCDTATSVPRWLRKCCSSQSRQASSRWSVGSSSNNSGGDEASTHASARRRCSPPERGQRPIALQVRQCQSDERGVHVGVDPVATARLEERQHVAVARQDSRIGAAVSPGGGLALDRSKLGQRQVDDVRNGGGERQVERLTEVADASAGSSVTRPAPGRSRPAISRSSVDLPAPLSPTTPTCSPGRTVSETLSSTTRRP